MRREASPCSVITADTIHDLTARNGGPLYHQASDKRSDPKKGTLLMQIERMRWNYTQSYSHILPYDIASAYTFHTDAFGVFPSTLLPLHQIIRQQPC